MAAGGDCILFVYMAATTTIRISTDTRDLLKSLSVRRGRPAGEVVAELARTASDELLLSEAEADFQRMAEDPNALNAYRSEALDVADRFDAPTPDW